MKNTVVFDLDGTLVHTSPSLGKAVNLLLKRIGREPLDETHVKEFIGNGARKLVSRTLEYLDVPESELTVDEALTSFFECYEETFLDTDQYPDIDRTLIALKDNGVTLCVLSNKPDKFVRPIVDHIFGKDVFAVAEGARAGVPHKPDPTALNDMLSRIGSDPDHCVFVGDSDVDVQIAKNVGCKCCAVDWGYRSHEVLEAAGPDCIVSDAQELLRNVTDLLIS